MRGSWIFGLLLAGSVAHAAPEPAEDTGGDFWRDILEPHGATVSALLTKARAAMAKAADTSLVGDDGIERRMQFLGDAYGMLRYARRLSPENTDVLVNLGTTADELGKTREALEALEACVRIQGVERAGPAVVGRLGLIDLRLGKLDDAIHWLRYVPNPLTSADNAAALVHLATALAARGDMAQAIDLLGNALPSQANYFSEALTLVSFALAVHYDRDEQRGAAFEVLDRMQATLQQELGPATQRALATMRFAPAEDELYYQAMLYEALGDYTEARAEWALYASVPGAAWCGRALDHIHSLDALRAAPPAAPQKPSSPIQISHRPVP